MKRCRIISAIVSASSNPNRIGKRKPALLKSRLNFFLKTQTEPLAPEN